MNQPVTGYTFYKMIGKALGIQGDCTGFTINCDGPGELVTVMIHKPLRLDDSVVLKGEMFHLVPTRENENADHQ